MLFGGRAPHGPAGELAIPILLVTANRHGTEKEKGKGKGRKQRGPLGPKFQVEGVAPIGHSFFSEN